MSDIHQMWAEKYRPITLDDYVFQNSTHKQNFEKYISTKSIPNILLSGIQGTGKSTIARILINSIGVDTEYDVMTLNASESNSVDDVRDRIRTFITTYSMSGIKIVLLEEADRLSKHAQDALKVLTEDYSEVARFIATCNNPHLLTPAFKSRFQQYLFKAPDVNDVALRIATILQQEGVKFNLDLVDKFVAIGFPDIRQTIMLIEQHVTDGKLQDPTVTVNGADWKIDLLTYVEKGLWRPARELLCSSVSSEEWTEVFSFLYRNIDKVEKWDTIKRDQAVVCIAQHLYQHSLVADPEINAAAMLIELSRI